MAGWLRSFQFNRTAAHGGTFYPNPGCREVERDFVGAATDLFTRFGMGQLIEEDVLEGGEPMKRLPVYVPGIMNDPCSPVNAQELEVLDTLLSQIHDRAHHVRQTALAQAVSKSRYQLAAAALVTWPQPDPTAAANPGGR